jgi:hypothetical protein
MLALDADIKISSGMAVVKIDGKVTENLYSGSIFDDPVKDPQYYNNPAIPEGSVTKNETKNMSAGDEYKFSVLPMEVVTINIISLDSNDVEVIVSQYGREKKYIVEGTNKFGIFLAFQNR